MDHPLIAIIIAVVAVIVLVPAILYERAVAKTSVSNKKQWTGD